jgi:hypothetical protein
MRAVSAADIEVPCAKMPAYTISSSFSELRFATEHEPTEAHLGIDLEQQLRQLRLADPVIERGAQLDQFRFLLLGRQGRQMQLVVDAQFTGLDGFGHGRDPGLGALDERLKIDLRPFG